MRGVLPRTVASALALIALAVFPASAAAKPKPKPNLTVTAVSSPPDELTVGSTFEVTDTTKNAGRKTAGASTTRYYLTTNPAQSLENRRNSKTNPKTSFTDILLSGEREVESLKRGKSSAAGSPTTVVVPGGTPTGTYFLLACADDRGVVKEKPETDNCKASQSSEGVGGPVSGSGRVDAMSDTAIPLPEQFEDTVIPPFLAAMACAQPVNPQKKTLAQAITSSRQYLTNTAGADAMAAFQASPEYQTAAASEEAAGAAALAEEPGAALAALIRAHELEPDEASHLINAGGVAAAIGRPNEALAFLDEALTLDDSDSPAMGVSRQAASLTSRGYAELQLGRLGPAQTALQAAIAVDPLMTEAQATLAGVRQCQGGDPVPAWRKGRKRQDREPPIDDSLGEETPMRAIQIPATARNAYSAEDYYFGLDQAAGAEQDAVTTAMQNLESQMDQERLTLNPATRSRTDGLRTMLYKASQAPDLVALRNQIDGLLGAGGDAEDAWGPIFGGVGFPSPEYLDWIQEVAETCDGDPDPNCFTREMRPICIPEVSQAHGAWSVAMDSAVTKSQQWMKTYSKRVSAIGSNYASAKGHGLTERYIEFNEIVLYRAIVSQAHLWSAILETQTDDNGIALCVQSPDPPGYTPPPPSPPQGPGGCPDALKSFSFSFALGPVNVSGNCEELTAGGSTPGWVGAFGEVTLNVREGSLTVFGGAKAEVGLGPLSGDFKSGAYVKFGSDGPRDAGWRVGPSYTVGAGPAQFGRSDTMDLSIVGALGSGPF